MSVRQRRRGGRLKPNSRLLQSERQKRLLWRRSLPSNDDEKKPNVWL